MSRTRLALLLLLPLLATACQSARDICVAEGHEPGTAAFRACEERVYDRWAAERRAQPTYTRSGGR